MNSLPPQTNSKRSPELDLDNPRLKKRSRKPPRNGAAAVSKLVCDGTKICTHIDNCQMYVSPLTEPIPTQEIEVAAELVEGAVGPVKVMHAIDDPEHKFSRSTDLEGVFLEVRPGERTDFELRTREARYLVIYARDRFYLVSGPVMHLAQNMKNGERRIIWKPEDTMGSLVHHPPLVYVHRFDFHLLRKNCLPLFRRLDPSTFEYTIRSPAQLTSFVSPFGTSFLTIRMELSLKDLQRSPEWQSHIAHLFCARCIDKFPFFIALSEEHRELHMVVKPEQYRIGAGLDVTLPVKLTCKRSADGSCKCLYSSTCTCHEEKAPTPTEVEEDSPAQLMVPMDTCPKLHKLAQDVISHRPRLTEETGTLLVQPHQADARVDELPPVPLDEKQMKRDWNLECQQSQQTKDRVAVAKQLEQHAKPIAMRIVHDRVTESKAPQFEAFKQPSKDGHDHYIVGNIRFSISDAQSMHIARKTARNAIRAANDINAITDSKVPSVNTALSCVFEYRGYSITATALVPQITAEKSDFKLEYGSNADGFMHTSEEKSVKEVVPKLAKYFRLAPHKVYKNGQHIADGVYFSGPAVYYKPEGSQFYFLNLDRLLPRMLNRHCMFRAEFLRSCCDPEKELSPDAWVFSAASDDNEMRAGKEFARIVSDVIPYLCKMIEGANTNSHCSNLSTVFHQCGVNMRFLGFVYMRLTRANKFVRCRVLFEMIVRTIKSNTRKAQLLMTHPNDDMVTLESIKALQSIVGCGPDLDDHAINWDQRIRGALLTKFGVYDQSVGAANELSILPDDWEYVKALVTYVASASGSTQTSNWDAPSQVMLRLMNSLFLECRDGVLVDTVMGAIGTTTPSDLLQLMQLHVEVNAVKPPAASYTNDFLFDTICQEIELTKHVLGQHHRALLRNYQSLLVLHERWLGNPKETENRMRKVIENMKVLLNDPKSNVTRAMKIPVYKTIIFTLNRRNLYTLSFDFCNDLIKLCEDGSVEDMADALLIRGIVLRNTRKLSDAMIVFDKAKKLLEKNKRTKTLLYASVLNSYAWIDNAFGDRHMARKSASEGRSNATDEETARKHFLEAEKKFEAALHIRMEMDSPESVLVAFSKHNLAVTYVRLGKKKEAIKMFHECLKLRERLLSKDNIDVAYTKSYLGKLLSESNDRQQLHEAYRYIFECLHVMERYYRDGHPKLITNLKRLIDIQHKLGNKQKAIDLQLLLHRQIDRSRVPGNFNLSEPRKEKFVENIPDSKGSDTSTNAANAIGTRPSAAAK